MVTPYLMDLRLMTRRGKTVPEMGPVDYWYGWQLAALANGAAVAAWVDSRRATALVQATADSQPTFVTVDASVAFAGTNDFLGDDGSEVCGAGDFTLAVRWKSSVKPGVGQIGYLFGEGNLSADNPVAAIAVDESGKPRLTIRTAAGDISLAQGSAGADLCDGVYRTLVGRYVQSTGAMSLNVTGVATTYTGTRAWAATTFNTTRLGCHGRTTNVSFFTGNITHCLRFSRALSNSETTHLLNRLS